MSALDTLKLAFDRAQVVDLPAAGRSIPLRWIGAALIASIVAVALMMRGAGLSIDPTAPDTLLFALPIAALAATWWRCRQPASTAARILRDIAESFGLFMAISLVGAVASYPVAAYSRGFADRFLYRGDLALHFDWVSWYQLVAAHPSLQVLSRAAYAMIYISPAILLGYLGITGQRRTAHNFLAAIWLSAALTLICFRFIPAVGPFAYLWHGPIPYMPVSDLWQPELIPQLRHHAMPAIDLGHLVGLVSAPSFHAAAAVLLIAFALRQPAIRTPLIAANVAMLLSTPVEGTHYLTDIILGGVVAGVSLGLIALISSRPARTASYEERTDLGTVLSAVRVATTDR